MQFWIVLAQKSKIELQNQTSVHSWRIAGAFSWEATYGLGHNYILSLPPSPDGIITPKMAASAVAFGTERHRRYGRGSSAPDEPSACEIARAGGRLAQWGPAVAAGRRPAAGAGVSRANQSELVLKLGSSPTSFDRVFLSEDVIHDGQLVAQYTVDYCDAPALAGCNTDGSWRTIVSPASVHGGQTIGTHHIDMVNATGASFVRLRLLEVLPAPTVPLVSFRVLRVATGEAASVL